MPSEASSPSFPADLAPLGAVSAALAALVERVGASTVAVRGRGGRTLASAVAWRDGLLVTSAHVFRRLPGALAVVRPGGAEARAAAVGADAATDLALFRLEGAPLPVPAFGEAQAVRAGQLVVAVGRAADGEVAASHGIVQRTGGAWQTWMGGAVDRLIRLDGGLHDGLSGSAVADAGGGVVGIASSALSRSAAMVLPVATVDRVVDALLQRGHVARAFLGLAGQAVDAAAGGAPDGAGLLVTGLVPEGPAARAGLRVGDILRTVGGAPAAALPALRHALADRIGSAVPVELTRGGEPQTLALTVGEWPRREACH